MTEMIPAVLVGSKCVEWYSCIIQSDFEEATELMHQVSEMLEKMEPDDKVIAYYNLLLFRYDLMMKQSSDQVLEICSNDNSAPYLSYMYHFFVGQREFYEGRYTSAVRLYGVAEKYLEEVHDRYERAEFYLRLADGYYRINQYTFATSYLEQSIEIFNEDVSYRNKVLNAQLILAAIDSELGNYESAEQRYSNAILEAHDYPKVHSLLLRSKGLNRVRQNKQSDAESLFKQALITGNHSQTVVGNKTKADLAFVYLRLNNRDEATLLLNEIKEWLQTNVEYNAKELIYCSLYLLYNKDGIQKGIDQLIANELYFDVAEIAIELSRFYEREAELGQALEYSRLALRMNSKLNQMGSVGIENSK